MAEDVADFERASRKRAHTHIYHKCMSLGRVLFCLLIMMICMRMRSIQCVYVCAMCALTRIYAALNNVHTMRRNSFDAPTTIPFWQQT